jgi:hypothetical protein
MLKDPFLRSVAASLGAWLFMVFGVPELWALSMANPQVMLSAPLFFGGILSALYAPWWFIDAMLLRPILLSRLGWIGVAPLEALSICAYRCFVQRDAIARGGSESIIIHWLKETLTLYGGYLALSMLLLHLLSRPADRKTSRPPN